jgi:hypothetical protein
MRPVKKTGTVLLIFFFLGMKAYSFEENWTSLGFEFGNSFDTGQNSPGPLETRTGAFGLNFNQYAFWNGSPFGYFLHNSILYIGMASVKEGIENFGSLQNESVVGAAFRFAITDCFKLLLNLGLSCTFLKSLYKNNTEEEYHSMETLNFGFNGGAALKYEIWNKRIFCNIGLRTTLHCLNYTSILSSSAENSRWAWNSLFGIKPCINIGFNLFNTGTHLGIPEKQDPAP